MQNFIKRITALTYAIFINIFLRNLVNSYKINAISGLEPSSSYCCPVSLISSYISLSFFPCGKNKKNKVFSNMQRGDMNTNTNVELFPYLYYFEANPDRYANLTCIEARNEIRRKRLSHTGGFQKPNDDSLLVVLNRQSNVNKIPVWIMRQAGRYLPEFHAIRSIHSFFDVCEDPYLASEVTLQPLRRFKNLNAVIIFSDILVIPKAMGMSIHMEPSVGPTFDWNIKDISSLDKLQLKPNVEDSLGYVFDAIYLTKLRLKNRKPLIGFCGGPFTIFTYMVHGKGDKSNKWRAAKLWLYEHPEESHILLHAIADLSVQYLVKQFDSGADVLQVFDTNAGILSPDLYEEFGVKYMKYIAEQVKTLRPQSLLIGFPKGNLLDSFLDSKFDAFSCDEKIQIDKIKEKFSSKFALQGNLDPQILYAKPEIIKSETKNMVKKFGEVSYVANLGHGMEPDMKPESVETFIDAVKDAS